MVRDTALSLLTEQIDASGTHRKPGEPKNLLYCGQYSLSNNGPCVYGLKGIFRGIVMMLHFIIIFGITAFVSETAHAKEPFNIKGIQIGDTMESLKKVFPEISVKPFENIARCIGGHTVIRNGSTFNAFKEAKNQKYSYKLIFVDGIQVVIKAEFSFASTSVSRELFLARINEKFDITIINDGNILKARHAMADYGGISHFVIPEGHFFKISEKDIFRLKYISTIPNYVETTNLTHTIIIESKKYNALEERQSAFGKEEKIQREKECGEKELKKLGF